MKGLAEFTSDKPLLKKSRTDFFNILIGFREEG